MQQDLRTCPSCGATSPDHSPCPFCGWTPERIEEPNPAALESSAKPSADAAEEARMDPDVAAPADTNIEPEDVPLVDEISPAQFRDLISQDDEAEHLLEQVPEEMRGVLAARLKAAQETDSPRFGETTDSTLQEEGNVVSEEIRASDAVNKAAYLEGREQPQTKLPICSNCQAASPVGETQCQWCGKPFSDPQ